jgi:hypothetical protein
MNASIVYNKISRIKGRLVNKNQKLSLPKRVNRNSYFHLYLKKVKLFQNLYCERKQQNGFRYNIVNLTQVKPSTTMMVEMDVWR